MLSKIININSYSDNYRRNSNIHSNQKHSIAGYHTHNESSDSVEYSSALLYLSKLNWHLKKMSKDKNGILLLDFICNGFEFMTVLDAQKINSQRYFDYEVSNLPQVESPAQCFKIKLSVKVADMRNNISNNPISFTFLPLLFNKIISMNIEKGFPGSDTMLMSNLLDGLTKGLNDEFNEITSMVLVFFEKLIGEIIELPKRITEVDNENIYLKEITRINAAS